MAAYRAIAGLKIAFAVVTALGVGLLTGSVLLGWCAARLWPKPSEIGHRTVGKLTTRPSSRWIGVPPGLIVAALVRDPLLSIWLFCLLAGLGYRWDVQRQRRKRDQEARQTTRELLRLLHNYLQGSLAAALERSVERLQMGGDLADALQRMVDDYNLGVAWEEGLAYLHGFGPVAERLALLLGAAPSLGEEAVVAHLERLAFDLERGFIRRAELERRRIRWGIRLDVGAGIAGAAVLVGLLLPPWREFYLGTLGQRLLLVLGTSLSALAYAYCSEELALLEVA